MQVIFLHRFINRYNISLITDYKSTGLLIHLSTQVKMKTIYIYCRYIINQKEIGQYPRPPLDSRS